MSAKDEAIKRKIESTIGLSLGKASGKTTNGTCPLWGDCNAPEHDKRIAELEADLEAMTTAYGVTSNAVLLLRERAEKAEAEVERLNKLFCRCNLGWWNCPAHKGIGRGVNPSGDTLGSKERDG